MKKIFYISFLVLLGLVFLQCDKEYDDLVTQDAKTGGLLDISNTSINYVVGDNKAYSYDLFVYQSSDYQVKTIKVYKSLYRVPVAWSDPDDTTHTTADSIPAKWSDEVLEETISITNKNPHSVSVTALDFTGLTANLTITGDSIPTSDGNMRIGDYFNFVVEVVMDDGTKYKQAKPVKMTISTRFAGTYVFVEGEYWRLSVLSSSGHYWEPEYVIESIDAKTYLMNGVCAWMDQTLYFQVEDDGTITYPESWNGADQTINDEPLITCANDATDMTNVYCSTSNYVVKDDVDGKDQLIMSFGYYTGGSGPREFYQILQKK